MTEPPTPIHRRPRTHAEYRWTGPKVSAFLHALRDTGCVSKAARSVGMTRQSAYRLRGRHQQIAALWQEGLALGRARRSERAMARLRGQAAESVALPQGDVQGYGAR